MENNEFCFWNLISDYTIEIPAIQRDYVQDRLYSDLQKKECDIVGDIQKSLVNQTKTNLHFVYGKVDNQELVPLDGQQRLTTLFLLYWFLSLGNLSDDDKKILSKFTYETRPSSEDFCLKLVKESIEYDKTQEISKQIINSKWFFLSWKNDPTISAMLNMLDIIQLKFKEPNKEFFYLLCGENCPVIFHFLPLEQFKLEDEIYVKMNSRGKPLTEFENFKANFSVLFDHDNQSKLDNEWLDIFWKYEKDNTIINLKEVDRKYLKFIENLSLCFLAENKDISKTDKDTFSIFNEYKEIYSSENNYLNSLLRIFDALTTYEDTNNYFESFLKSNPDYWEYLRFYSVALFFIQCGKIKESNVVTFNRWIRVCANLINNTLIQSPETFYKAVRSLKQLTENINNLYEYLSKTQDKIDGFLQKQIEEEKNKSNLILQYKNWEEEIYKIEKHNYFNGQIGFILEFSKSNERYDIDIFKDYSTKLKILFSDSFKDGKNCLFHRALLTFGDYLAPINYCKTFCTFNESLREKMENWRKVFEDKNKSIFLKNLLDAINIDNIENDLQKIINNYSEVDWKGLFIKNKGIIEYCDKYRIAKRENKIYLSKSPADNWRRHAELYSYILYLELNKEKQNVSYFISSDDTPWIHINWKSKSYYIQEEDYNYSFGFCKGNDDNEGLIEMQQYVEKVIGQKNLSKSL